MNAFLSFIISQVVLLPLLMGVIRFAYIKRYYYPFFILLCLGFSAEVLGYYVIQHLHHTNAPIIKIYSLLECVLILYQFKLWKFLQRKGRSIPFVLLTAISLAFWFIESILFQKLFDFTPYFRMFYAFIIVLVSINAINYMIAYQTNILKNARFLICIGFIIFFTYQILYEGSYLLGSENPEIENKIQSIFIYLNAFVNVLYAIAIYFVQDAKEEHPY